MQFARDLNGLLIKAEKNTKPGNYLCPHCNELVHWVSNSADNKRIKSVDNKRPHFYHAEENKKCKLAAGGGNWDVKSDGSLAFTLPATGKVLVFEKKIIPDLTKIPSVEEAISNMRISLSSTDHSQVDRTLEVIYQFFVQQGQTIHGPIPLPVSIEQLDDGNNVRHYKRLIDIESVTSGSIDKLSHLNIPDGVDLAVKLTDVE